MHVFGAIFGGFCEFNPLHSFGIVLFMKSKLYRPRSFCARCLSQAFRLSVLMFVINPPWNDLISPVISLLEFVGIQ